MTKGSISLIKKQRYSRSFHRTTETSSICYKEDVRRTHANRTTSSPLNKRKDTLRLNLVPTETFPRFGIMNSEWVKRCGETCIDAKHLYIDEYTD